MSSCRRVEQGICHAEQIRPGIFVLSVIVVTALGQPLTGQQRAARDANVQTLVSRLELGRYKSTIEALSRFGDRRQGTRRNRDAVDWIEAQLKSYGCAGVERLTYQYTTPRPSAARRSSRRPATDADAGSFKGSGPGGSMIFGRGRRPTVNRDLMAQPDPKIRALNQEEPVDGERQEVYCTKVGTVTPGRDVHRERPHGRTRREPGVQRRRVGNRAGDGTRARLQRTRRPHRSIDSVRAVEQRGDRIEWRGSLRQQRASRQGIEDPPGSGRYPEPRWLGMIQHDMMLFDHGAPGADGV